jgi:hypothetical protein
MTETATERPLMVECFVNKIPAYAYLDTGAAVCIIGSRLLDKLRTTGKTPRETGNCDVVKMKGINSSKPVEGRLCDTQVHFGDPKREIEMKAVICEEWSGDLIISWPALKQLRMTMEQTGSGLIIQLKTLGITLKEVKSKEQAAVLTIGRTLAAAYMLGEDSNQFAKGRKRRNKSLQESLRIPVNVTNSSEIALLNDVSVTTEMAEQDGKKWELSEFLRRKLGPKIYKIVRSQKSTSTMPTLRTAPSGTTVLLPWSPGSSITLETLSRATAIPRLTSSINLMQKEGRKYGCVTPWLVCRISSHKEASEWRSTYREYFTKMDEKESRTIRYEMREWWQDEPREVEPSGKYAAKQVLDALIGLVLSQREAGWSSHNLIDEATEGVEIDDLFPPSEEDSKIPFASVDDLAKSMKGLNGVPDRIKTKLAQLAWKYRECFGPVGPGKMKEHVHRLELKESRSVRAPIYRIHPGDEDFVREEIQKLVKENYIQEIRASSFLAPIVVVPKKGPNGTKKKRLCIDYRQLNEATKPDLYKMPSVEASLRVGNAGIFTKMDLASAFWQVPIYLPHQERTAFSFQGKTYICKVMPFGLRNAPATFQRIMDEIFGDVIH